MFTTTIAASTALIALAIYILRLTSPSLVLLSTLSILFTRPSSARSSPSPITSVVVETRTPRRAAILSLLSLSALSYLLDGLTFVIYVVIDKSWPERTGVEVGAVLGLVAFGGMAAVGAWKDVRGIDVWTLKRVKVGIGAAVPLDIAQIVLLALAITRNDNNRPHIPEIPSPLPISIPTLLHLAFPTFRVLVLVPLFYALSNPRTTYTAVHSSNGALFASDVPTDTSLLLPPEEAITAPSSGLSPLSTTGAGTAKYGTFGNSNAAFSSGSHSPTTSFGPNGSHIQRKVEAKPEVNLDPTWSEMWLRVRRLSPYLWPSKSVALQFLSFLCLIILVLGRIVNLLVPLTLGKLVNIFEQEYDRSNPSPAPGPSPWPYLFAYVGLRFIQGSGGLGALRSTLWVPVMQYSDREMSQMCFEHLLNLSLAFHTRRKTGEVLRILDRGAAINHILELLLFNIVPTLFDILIALVAFVYMFEWTLALVLFFVMFAYFVTSIVLTAWRTKIRRQMNDKDVITRGIHTDCLLNWETVKYFNGEQYEGERYSKAVRDYQALEYKVMLSLNVLNLAQNLIITLGLLVGSMIVALRVTKGTSSGSDFVVFITYLAQLYGPLNNLGMIYRSINSSLVDTERLMKLLNEPTEVNDKPGAPDLIVEDGEIEFENVFFSYDGRTTALNGVSFKIPKGSSVALVGESGSGKSTVLRLLYRFYDLQEGNGRILVDGRDIRDVTQASLRKAIGVVPQDSVLFNASIKHNIGYGKIGSTDEEIEAAAKAAQMHDRIMSFPDLYETKVGERGVRLSGGEKQRVAIARTLLKNPPILLLDEATSALDTSTEKDIQKALQNLVQGRSSLSIAHRLSTIASANIILVLKDGQVIEQGTHSQLLAQNGTFAAMWADQISAEEPDVLESGNVQKEAVGYDIATTERAPEVDVLAAASVAEEIVETQPVLGAGSPTMDSPQVVSLDFPTEEATPEDDAGEHAVVTDAELSSPPHEPQAASPERAVAPLAFPSSDDAASEQPSTRERENAQSHGVTFISDTTSLPRSGTPDPESKPKRQRISSQNFQRLARRLSLGPRRQSSGSGSNPPSPGLPREGSSPTGKLSREGSVVRGSREGSVRGEDNSPTASTTGLTDDGKGKSKKDKKKEKKRSIL